MHARRKADAYIYKTHILLRAHEVVVLLVPVCLTRHGLSWLLFLCQSQSWRSRRHPLSPSRHIFFDLLDNCFCCSRADSASYNPVQNITSYLDKLSTDLRCGPWIVPHPCLTGLAFPSLTSLPFHFCLWAALTSADGVKARMKQGGEKNNSPQLC